MKKQIVSAVLCAVMVMLAFSGCSMNMSDPETLMSPPKLTGGYQDLQDVFEKEVGSNVALVAPVSGEYKSAFIIEDFDADSIEEAMVFYSVKEKEETVNVGIFQKQKNEWKYIKSVEGIG